MALCKHRVVDIPDHRHIRKMSNLDEPFISRYFMDYREREAPSPTQSPPYPTSHTQPEAINFNGMDPALKIYIFIWMRCL